MRRLQLALAAVGLAVTVTGCPKEPASNTGSGDRPSTSGGTAGKPAENSGPITIAVVPKGIAQSFWLSVKQGAEDAGKEAGATIEWNGPAEETDVDGQIRIIQNYITKKVSAIVMAACDAKGLVPYVKAAVAAGIPVITIDSGLSEDVSTAFLATDNVKGGEVAAEALNEILAGKGKVGIIPFVKGAGSSDDRENGFKKGLAKFTGLDLGGRILYSNAKVDEALDKAKSMMTSSPDLAGIFAANQSGGEGTIEAVKQAGKVGKVKLVCYDASDKEIAALKEGVVSALIVQNPYRMGFDGVKTALKAIKKEKIDSKFIDTGVTKVTKENLDTPEIQKLLNPVKK